MKISKKGFGKFFPSLHVVRGIFVPFHLVENIPSILGFSRIFADFPVAFKGEMFYNKGHQVVESGLKFHMVGEKWFPVPPVPLSAPAACLGKGKALRLC